MDKYFVALCPESKLSNLIYEKKEQIKNKAGDQKYLSHPAHTTLVVFTTNDIDYSAKCLERVANKISKVPVSIGPLHVFYNDLLTGKHTINYIWGESSLDLIKDIQLSLGSSPRNYNLWY